MRRLYQKTGSVSHKNRASIENRQFLAKAEPIFYICSPCPSGERALSEPVEPVALRRDRSPAARRMARRRKAEREMGIVSLLNRGVSIAEIADQEGVSERGMRKYVRALLARRAPQPHAEFLALQVSRLSEALLVAYGAMSGGRPRGSRSCANLSRLTASPPKSAMRERLASFSRGRNSTRWRKKLPFSTFLLESGTTH